MADDDDKMLDECRRRWYQTDRLHEEIFRILNGNPNGVVPRLSRLEGLLKGVSIVGFVLLVILAALEIFVLLWRS